MSVTILYGDRTTVVPGAHERGGHVWLAPADLASATGWKLEDVGLCQGDACVRTQAEWVDVEGRIDLSAFAAHQGQPELHEADGNLRAYGASVNTRRDALFSLEAPDFTLPDLDGKLHSLSDYRGKKVFLYSWGSY